MSEQFKLLGSNEVVTVENYHQIVISHSTFRVGELTEALMQDLSSFVTADYGGKQKECLEKGWFEDSINCEILRLGGKNWQKGKVRIKVTLEFCPDEPEIEEILGNNQSEINQTESPLDDIRQMMHGNS
mgnify:CR=1 FL=1